MRRIFLTIVLITVLSIAAHAQNPTNFINAAAQWVNPPSCDPTISDAELAVIAKFTVLAPSSYIWGGCGASGSLTTWDRLHAINPYLKAFGYNNGIQYCNTVMVPQQGCFNGNSSAINVLHGVGKTGSELWYALGSIFGDYLIGSFNSSYAGQYLMDIFKTGWTDYWKTNVWPTAWVGQPWTAAGAPTGTPGTININGLDGMFIDNGCCVEVPLFKVGHAAGDGDPAFKDYPGAAYPDVNINYSYGVLLSPSFQTQQRVIMQAAITSLKAAGHDAVPNGEPNFGGANWAFYDQFTDQPYAWMMELGMSYSDEAAYGGQNFSGEINTLNTFQRVRPIVHFYRPGCENLNAVGFANLTCHKWLWGSLSLYWLGRKANPTTSFFGWTPNTAQDAIWVDELDSAFLHMGIPEAGMENLGGHLYRRRYTDGYVYYNAGTADQTGIATPGGLSFRVCDHTTFKTCDGGSLVTSFALTHWTGLILLSNGKSITNSDNGGSQPLAVENTTLANAIDDVPYSQTLICSGGTPPCTWGITGALPAGLTRTGAVISGTPTSPGTSNFVVTATDTLAATANQALSITVNAASAADVSDNFSGSGSTQCLSAYSANWLNVQDGGTTACIKVNTSGRVFGATVDFLGLISRWNASVSADQESSIIIGDMPADGSNGNQILGCAVRISGTGVARNFYGGAFYKDTGSVQTTNMYKIFGGAYSGSMGFPTVTWVAGDRMTCSMTGSTFTLKQNGVTVGTAQDVTLTTGTFGIIASGGSGSQANISLFEGSSLSAPADPALITVNTPSFLTERAVYGQTATLVYECLNCSTATLTIAHSSTGLDGPFTQIASGINPQSGPYSFTSTIPKTDAAVLRVCQGATCGFSQPFGAVGRKALGVSQ